MSLCSQVIEQLLHSRLKYDEAVKKMSTEDQEFYRYVRKFLIIYINYTDQMPWLLCILTFMLVHVATI